MKRLKTFRLFESNSLDYIEGELEDIVIHFCEGTNAEFKLQDILCDGGVFVFEISNGDEIRSRRDWWDFVKIHNNMSNEFHYELWPLGDYLIFTKYVSLKNTFIEILDWISRLELDVNTSDFNNGYVRGKKLVCTYSYRGKKLIQWNKYINSDGVESLAAMRDSFKDELPIEKGGWNTSYVYVSSPLYLISSGFIDWTFTTLKSWLVERDPLFKKFNISVNKLSNN